MDKQTQLTKFGFAIKHRREALKYSVRELADISGVSAALISKLENGQMKNFPKNITIELLSKGLKFQYNELYILANVLFEANMPEPPVQTFDERLRELLATSTNLSAENIDQAIYFIKGLELLEKINYLNE